MPRYVAFLRAINVGGHVVKMEALRVLFESLKFKSVETFIASGNVIFETSAMPAADLQTKIEMALRKALGYEVCTFVRTDGELREIVRYKPFPESATLTAATFCVGFMYTPMAAEAEQRVLSFRNPDDDFHVHGSELYWLSRGRQSDSTFSNALFEKTLKIQATFRGITTVRKLAAKYPAC
ncbi:MAG TPA: DUF1697 domain-containing protein [Candidatus Saccharimonadales bacterium]|nr:DUF1697 domain-containing protein [Candidatus Saccharimonadales bacterium]